MSFGNTECTRYFVYKKTPRGTFNKYRMLDLQADYISKVHCRSHQERSIKWQAISVLLLKVSQVTKYNHNLNEETDFVSASGRMFHSFQGFKSFCSSHNMWN